MENEKCSAGTFIAGLICGNIAVFLCIFVWLAFAGRTPQDVYRYIESGATAKVPVDMLAKPNDQWLARYDDCFDTQLAYNVRMLREILKEQGKRIAAIQTVKPVENEKKVAKPSESE